VDKNLKLVDVNADGFFAVGKPIGYSMVLVVDANSPIFSLTNPMHQPTFCGLAMFLLTSTAVESAKFLG
jgi:hypothetical protein